MVKVRCLLARAAGAVRARGSAGKKERKQEILPALQCRPCIVKEHRRTASLLKVRQQLAGPEARNLVATAWQVVRGEGLMALQRGIVPAVARGVLYGGEAVVLRGWCVAEGRWRSAARRRAIGCMPHAPPV